MDALKKPLKVVFVCGDQSGPHYHDIFIPTTFFHKYNLLECESQHTLDFHQLITADILHFQRQYAPESYMVMRQLKQTGKVCIFLCDDNVWEIPQGNPALGTYSQADVINRYQRLMIEAHACTTSTPYLASKCEKFNPKTYLFRNLVDPAIADLKSPGSDDPSELRIGWTGTVHHHDDAALFDDALFEIIKRYPRVKLVFMGYHPPTLNIRYPKNRFEYYAFVPVDAWYASLANLDLDIGLVPLIEHPFNWAKTCRKFQEYSILSATTIASPVGEYKALPSKCLHLLKGNSTRDWIDGLVKVIEDEQYRKSISQNAYNYIMSTHDINKYIGERAQIYYDIYANITGTERIQVWEKPEEDESNINYTTNSQSSKQ